jgi:RNA polymerase sigma-70 factor (ECF subfamily)
LDVPPPLPAESPEVRAALSEEQRALSRALEALSAEERKLLEHAYFLGLTQSELSERFGLPLGTVKTRIRTALMTLRRELQQVMLDARGYRV